MILTKSDGSPKVSLRELMVGATFAALLIWNVVYWSGQSAVLSDAIADWAQVQAIQTRVDPYTDVVELAARFGAQLAQAGSTELGSGEWIHPRTPGALLLLYPIGFMDSTTVHDAYLVGGAVALWILAAHLVVRVSPLDRGTLMLGTALLLASAPIISAFEYGTVSLVVACLVVLVWVAHDSDAPWIPGLALGLAAILKAWPAILLIPLLVHRRFRLVVWCVGPVIALELAAASLFGISPSETLTALSSASDRWIKFSANGSLTAVIARWGVDSSIATLVMIMLGICIVAMVSVKHRVFAYPLAISVGLLVSPLSWEHYDVVLLAIAAATIAYPIWPRVLTSGFLVIAFGGMAFRRWATDEFTPIGLRTVAGRLLMLGAIALSLGLPNLHKKGEFSTSVRSIPGRVEV